MRRVLLNVVIFFLPALIAGCSLQRHRDITAPTAVCAGPPGPIAFVGWTTANLPPGSVTLTWDAAPGVVAAYVVELGTTRGAANVGTVVASGDARSHTYDRLAAGDYFGRVRARNECGTSAPSNEANPRVR
jgi:hypothetical protein